MKKKFLLSVIFLLIVWPGQTQEFDFNPNCQKAYQQILKLDFEKANTLIQFEYKHRPENLIPVYLQNYIDFLTVIIGEEKQQFELLEKKKDSRLDKIREGDKNSPYFFILPSQHQYAMGLCTHKI
jgi:hypothetical protein